MDEAPPSLSSSAMSYFDQQQYQVVDPYSSGHNPSLSKVRSLEDPQQLPLTFEAGTQSRAINLQPAAADRQQYDGVQPLSVGSMTRDGGIAQPADTYEVNGSQPLSVGALARGVNSQTGAGGLSYGAGPNISDVARREASQTGQSTANLDLPEGDYIGMSFNAKNFARVYPSAYQKPEDK